MAKNQLQEVSVEREKTIRVIVECDEHLADQLDAAGEITGIRTRRGVIEDALALYFIAVSESQEGRKIVSLSEDSQTCVRLMTPGLRSAAREHLLKPAVRRQ